MTVAVTVSLHAVERFRERFWDGEAAQIAALLLADGRRAAIAAGASRIMVPELDLVVVAEGSVVVTCYTLSSLRRGKPTRRQVERGRKAWAQRGWRGRGLAGAQP